MVTLSKYGANFNTLLSKIDGLSTESKPVEQFSGKFIENGSLYVEIDTGKQFMYDKEHKKWHIVNFNGGSGGGDTSLYATALSLSINSDTYVMSAFLLNEDGKTVGEIQTIDLPLESMVIGGSYDNTEKKVILTLKNGNTIDFSVADLVNGLQSEITTENKLNSDLVSDTNQTNKFVTADEKLKITNALTKEEYDAGKTVEEGTTVKIDEETITVGKGAEIFNRYDKNQATGTYSHAEGSATVATGEYSHAEGISSKAIGEASHAEGFSTASGSHSHAEGYVNTASGSYSHAEGYGSTAQGAMAHAEGLYGKAIGEASHAESSGQAYGDYSHAEGAQCITKGKYSHASGLNSLAYSDSQYVIGQNNISDEDGKYAFIIGNGGKNSSDSFDRSNALAIDWNGLIYVNNAETGVDVSNITVTEEYNAGKTLEKGSKVTINGSVKTVADNAEIFNDYENNKAASSFSHAEGSKTGAAGLYSHAEGYQTVALGTASHSEGYNSKATGNNSHAEGYGCNSSGIQSHSEGNSNTSSGDSSHAEGTSCTASGNHSHAEGSGTIAASANQHVQGKYNISDNKGKYAFIIGNGTTTKRSNAIAVDWDGKIYVGNSETGIDLNDLLSRIEALENA